MAGLLGRPPSAAAAAVCQSSGAAVRRCRLVCAGGVGGREGLGGRLVVPVDSLRVLRSHVGRDVVGQRAAEGLLGVGQRDPVLRALRPGQRRHDGGEVELELLGEARLGVGVVPEALLLGVGLDQRELLRRSGR